MNEQGVLHTLYDVPDGFPMFTAERELSEESGHVRMANIIAGQ